MDLKVLTFFLLGAAVGLSAPASASEGNQFPVALIANQKEIWRLVMRSHYGPYDKSSKCWTRGSAEDHACMRPLELEIKVSGSELLLFFSAVAAGDSCHACAGTLGLIVYRQRGDNFVFEARNGPRLEIGAWGDAPAATDVSIMALNDRDGFAWRIEGSYGNQGTMQSTVFLFAPISGSVAEIGQIPIGYSNSGACGPDVNEKCTELSGALEVDGGGAEPEYDTLTLNVFGLAREEPFVRGIKYSFDKNRNYYVTTDQLPDELVFD
jgi:hypothetical protein